MVATLFGVLGALVSFYVNWPLLEAAIARAGDVSMDQVAAKYIGQTYVPSLALSFEDGVGTRTRVPQ